MSYFIKTYTERFSKTVAAKINRQLHAIDPSAEFVTVNIPGNNIHAWIERPNDGCNDYLYMRERHQQLRAVVERVAGGR